MGFRETTTSCAHATPSSPTVAQVGTVCTCGCPFLKFASSVPNSIQLFVVARQVETEDATTNESFLFACSFFLPGSFTANYHGVPVSHWPSDSVSDEECRTVPSISLISTCH